MSLVQNERIKLTASWINAMSGGAMAAGVIAPLAAASYGVPSAPPSSVLLFAVAAFGFQPESSYILRRDTCCGTSSHDRRPDRRLHRRPLALVAIGWSVALTVD